MEYSCYRHLLNEISKRLRSSELESMKFLLKNKIPARRMEEITRALALFDALEERDLLGPNDFSLLRDLLINSCEGRVDIINILDGSLRDPGHSAISSPIFPSPPTTPPGAASPDLREECEYLSGVLGTKWKQMCRKLPGIKEADFDSAKELHRGMLAEQILYVLNVWKSRNAQTASREALIQACSEARMQLYADEIKRRTYSQ